MTLPLLNMSMVSTLVLLAALGSDSAGARPPEERGGAVHSAPRLLFQSGFEPGTRIVGKKIVGADATRAKSDWSVDLGAFAGATAINLGTATHGEVGADIVPDPVDPSNATLRFTLRNFTRDQGQQKARAQFDLYAIRDGLREFTYSTEMYIDPGFNCLNTYPVKIDWLTVAEFWNNEFWVDAGRYGFRITVGLGKGEGTHPLNFTLTADTADMARVWQRSDPAALVPIGKWFRLDYYFLEGDRNSGRFIMDITPRGEPTRTLYDVTDYTRNPRDPAPDGMTGFNPFKLYTSRGIIDQARKSNVDLKVYWDNFALYRGNALARLSRSKTH